MRLIREIISFFFYTLYLYTCCTGLRSMFFLIKRELIMLSIPSTILQVFRRAKQHTTTSIIRNNSFIVRDTRRALISDINTRVIYSPIVS